MTVEDLKAIIERPNILAAGARVSHSIESLSASYNEQKRDPTREGGTTK